MLFMWSVNRNDSNSIHRRQDITLNKSLVLVKCWSSLAGGGPALSQQALIQYVSDYLVITVYNKASSCVFLCLGGGGGGGHTYQQ